MGRFLEGEDIEGGVDGPVAVGRRYGLRESRYIGREYGGRRCGRRRDLEVFRGGRRGMRIERRARRLIDREVSFVEPRDG